MKPVVKPNSFLQLLHWAEVGINSGLRLKSHHSRINSTWNFTTIKPRLSRVEQLSSAEHPGVCWGLKPNTWSDTWAWKTSPFVTEIVVSDQLLSFEALVEWHVFVLGWKVHRLCPGLPSLAAEDGNVSFWSRFEVLKWYFLKGCSSGWAWRKQNFQNEVSWGYSRFFFWLKDNRSTSPRRQQAGFDKLGREKQHQVLPPGSAKAPGQFNPCSDSLQPGLIVGMFASTNSSCAM